MSEVPLKALDEKFCTECGGIIKIKAEICPKCGVRQVATGANFGDGLTKTAPNGRSKLAAVLFALLLGGLGIHKFYLGRIGQGVLYLIFCWTFIPSIISFIEGILYLVMSEQEFNQKYGGE